MQERRRSQGITGWLQTRRIGTHLWLIVLPVLVGLVVVIGSAIWNNVQSQRNAQAEDLEHHSDDLEFKIQASLAGLSGDLAFFGNFLQSDASFAEYESILQDNTLTIEQKRDQVAFINEILSTTLESRPDYIAVSILTPDGEELAKVERSIGTEIINVYDAQLVSVADEPYAQEGRQLRRGLVWVSPVELRRDSNGLVAIPQQPFVRLVTPLTNSEQENVALLVIQADISSTFSIINNHEGDANTVAYLVDAEGYYLAHNENPELAFGRDLNPDNKVGNPNAEVILSGVSNSEFELREGDETYLGATTVIQPFADIPGLANPEPWVVVVGEPQNLTQFIFVGENIPYLVLGTIILVLVAAMIPFQRRAILSNITQIQNSMKQFGVGDLDARLPENVPNEFGDLHRNFNRNAKFVQGMIQGLETSVQARIRDLDITAEISREAAGLRDVNLIMNRTINRIVERFDFYHAQIFLVDDLRQNAVLVASTNEPGRRLLAKQHKLAVGSQSVIGRVSSLGVTVIAGDTMATDVPWKPNVELPETRSEMALPLKVEDVVIGALDIQSIKPDAFTQSDIEVFQVLSDQLSIAINNARLLEESNKRVEEIAELNARLTEQAWEEFSARKPSNTQVGFRYNLMEIQEEQSTALTVVGETDGKTTIPLKIRGLEVGSIETAQADMNEDDKALMQAVAERIAIALDNARLFEETQITLSESRRLYETSRQISSAADLDLEAVYKIVSDQLVFHETLEHSAILIAQPIPSPRANFLELSYQWVREGEPFWEKKHQLPLLQQGLGGFYQDNPREMLSFANRAEIDDMNLSMINEFVEKLASESLVLLPIVAGIKWFGLVLLSSRTRNAFDGAFMNYALAVADQLAIAIENRRLLDEVQTEARRSQALAEAGQLANQMSGDFQAGVARLFQSVSTPGNFNRWWFGLVETDNTVKKIDASSRNMPDVIPISVQNAVAAAVRLRETILVNDLNIEHPVVGQLNPTSVQLFGKHLAVPVMLGDHVLGALLIGRDESAVDLSDDDIQLASTLASQLSVAIENQNLFTSIQRQQETLQTTLETMPAGIMLLDHDQQVLLINRRAIDLFGSGIRDGFFTKDTHPIFYVDTENPYTRDEFPINTVFASKEPIIENISVVQDDGTRIDLLVNASPVLNEANQISSVVAVFQEITELRELEKALHASLSETTILYEASKSILGATATEDIGPALIGQIKNLEADELYLILESTDELEILPPHVSVSMPPLPVDEPLVSDIPLPGELLMPDHQLLISNMEDADIDPNIAAAALEANVKAMSATPLVARGQTLGWLVILYHSPHEFGTEDRRFINSLADQTAISLDSIRLFESTEKALQSVASLYQSSRRVAEAQGVLDVIEITREELLNFDPDRIDLLIQKSAEIVDEMYFAIAWAKEVSLEHVPSLPVSSETAEPLTDFDPFNRYEFYIENFLNDDGEGELHQALFELDTPYQAVISVPLRVGGRTIGRIGMGFLRPRRFNSDERQLISTLADATAYVVENDLLLEQTQESLEETGVLYQASRTIANAETREEIVEALIDYAASAQVDKTMLISLMSRSWDEPDAVIEITSTWGSDEVASLQGLFFTSDQFPIWEQLATQEIIWYDNIDTDTEITDNARMGYQALGIVSVAVVPLRTPTGIIGCVVFGSSEPRKHENREVRIYQSLADQAAVQLENKRLFDQAEFRARQLATAAEVSRAVTSILNLDNLFPRVVDLILDAFDYDHVQIFMVERDGKSAVVRASTGEAGRQLLAIKHSLQVGSSSVIGRVTSQGEPIIALDTSDPEVVHRPNPYLPETRSEMALPIFVQGKVVGALDVQSNRPQAFDADDIQALTPLVDQLSVAIENARLFELAQRRAEEMQFLFDVTTAAAAETHLDESLEVVIQILLQNIQASASTIFLYEPLGQVLISKVEARRDLKTGRITLNPNEAGISLAIGEGIVGWVAQTRQPAMVGDLLTDPRYRQDYTESLSGIYVPLMAGNELIGVLAMESTQYRFFDDSHLRLLQALSNSVSAIISNTQLLDEVQRTNERLREVDQLKTNFLAAMSHELRTPLNSIIGFSRVILKGIDGPITDMQKQDIQTIHDSGKHLLGLVNDILDQAKIEAGKMELTAEYFDIAAVINGVMSTAHGLIHGKTIRLYTEIDEGLPMAFGDEFRTRQILFNLVSNASKFTKEGNVTVKARIIHKEDSSVPFIEVGVTDTGIGIAEKDFENLFAAFQQVDNTTTRSVEGTGLGLPLARSLARLQGGDIYFESTVGVGSTFFVSVPTQPVVSAEEQAQAEKGTLPQTGILKALAAEPANGHPTPPVPTPQVPTATGGGRKILAVDDDIEMLDLYKRYLDRNGWYVIGITEPERVEELVLQHQPEIILLDVNMPNRTGWQVLESLKANDAISKIPVIVCSIDDNRHRSGDLGAANHLIKPFMESDLLKAVRDIEQTLKHNP